MFKAISWGQYTGVLFLLLLAYYAYVGLAYYRVELLGLLKNKGNTPGSAPTLDRAPAAARPAGKKSLIAKAALAVPAAPTEEDLPEENEAGEGVDKETPAEVDHQQEEPADEQPAPIVELPPFELPAIEASEENNYENYGEISFTNDNSVNFDRQSGSNSFLDAESGVEPANDDFYVGSTVGIAQLGDYLTSAAEGQVTPAQLVEQEPALANTDLLLAFFQTSTKSAQRVTAQLYEGVAEPALD